MNGCFPFFQTMILTDAYKHGRPSFEELVSSSKEGLLNEKE